jgi:hypothetical protein
MISKKLSTKVAKKRNKILNYSQKNNKKKKKQLYIYIYNYNVYIYI